MKVEDVMTREVRTVELGAPLKEVAATLAEAGISGLPVVDAGGAVVGVVSEADILYKERLEPEPRRGLLGMLLATNGFETALKLHARTAEEAMTAPAVTIGPRRPVAEAATRMLDEGVNRLPVIDDGKLVGIVTRADLVRAFMRTDEAIEREIRNEVLVRMLWIPPEQVQVRVSNGDVTISGHVGSESEAELVEQFAQRVPGVISVSADVSWNEV